MPDWQAIRADYEMGISQRSLAAKYGISQAAISKKSAKEQWVIKPVITPSYPVISDNPDELTNLPTVDKAIALIARRLDEEPDNKDIKLLADALSQFHKIKITTPQEEQESADSVRELLAYCTDEEISIIKPVLAAATLRKQQEQEKIHPIRRIG